MNQIPALFAQQANASDINFLFVLLIYVAVIFVAVIIPTLAGMWATFAKAGKPGWACIIPIYNVIVMLEIAGKPFWWILLLFIPIVNIVIAMMMLIGMAKTFGKGAVFGLGLAFLPFIFYPLLGFGDAEYHGPLKTGTSNEY